MQTAHWRGRRPNLYERLANAPTPLGWCWLALIASATAGAIFGVATN